MKVDIENSTERVQKHGALKVRLDFKNTKQKIDVVAKNLMFICLNCLLQAKYRPSISQSCNETLSPASKSGLSQKLSNEAENPLIGIHQSVSKKRDKTSNCVRHLENTWKCSKKSMTVIYTALIQNVKH